jgi:hypothetical protein
MARTVRNAKLRSVRCGTRRSRRPHADSGRTIPEPRSAPAPQSQSVRVVKAARTSPAGRDHDGGVTLAAGAGSGAAALRLRHSRRRARSASGATTVTCSPQVTRCQAISVSPEARDDTVTPPSASRRTACRGWKRKRSASSATAGAKRQTTSKAPPSQNAPNERAAKAWRSKSGSRTKEAPVGCRRAMLAIA